MNGKGTGGSDLMNASLSMHPEELLLLLGAGLVAGMLGLGGGMIIGPLLLELGVHPQVRVV